MRPEALEHGPVEEAEEAASMDRVLRPPVAGGEATGLAPDALTVLVVEHELASGQPGRRQVVGQAQLGELAHGVGEHVDPDTELGDHRCRLEELDVVDPGSMERQRERQTPDATTGHEDPHRHHAVVPRPS
jgi:hypothetical protein